MQKQTMEVGNNLIAPTTTITSHLQNVKLPMEETVTLPQTHLRI